MDLPGGHSRGGALCSHTSKTPLVPCILEGGDFGRGFLLQGGRVNFFFFFLLTQLVVPHWLVFVLKSRGKGGFCQCLLIRHSNMTPCHPFTGQLQCSLILLPEMESLFPERKLLCLQMQEVSYSTGIFRIAAFQILNSFNYLIFTLFRLTACLIISEVFLNQYTPFIRE